MIKIPSKFTIHCHEIKVVIVPELDSGDYARYDNVKEEITVASGMRDGAELISLSETQILASFLHELIHAFQWHSGKEFSEEEAQTYSGLLLEFLKTKEDELSSSVCK